MAPTTETRFSDNTSCQPFALLRAISLYSSRITHLLIVPGRLLHCWKRRRLASSVHSSGRQTAWTSVRWGVLQQRVYRGQIRDVEHLKQRLIKEWRHFDQKIIDRAVYQWRSRLANVSIKMEDISNTWFKCTRQTDWQTQLILRNIWVTFCKMWNINSTVFDFKETSQFCLNSVLVDICEILFNLAQDCWCYRKMFHGLIFFPTQCT